MIFDSPQAEELIKAYKSTPKAILPRAVFLVTSDKLAGERTYIEELVGLVSGEKQNLWFTRILSKDYGMHLSAWFEIMLFG